MEVSAVNRRHRSVAILIGALTLALSTPLLWSHPAPSPQAVASLGFGVIGDSGQIGPGQRRVAQQLKAYRDTKDKFEFAIMVGDNVYPDGVGRGLKAHFEDPFRALLDDGVKFYAALGNHDIRRGEDLQLNYDKFNMGGKRYYSFVKGNGLIEFFALDSTVLDTEIDRLERSESTTLSKRLSML